MKFTMTKEDIEKGIRCDSFRCPVARAIRRKVKAGRVRVMTNLIIIRRREFPTPKKISDWIYDFDRNRKVRPITFELDYEK